METVSDITKKNDSVFDSVVDEMQFSSNGDLGKVRLPERFAAINKLIMRDLNGRSQAPSFYLYKKQQVMDYLKDPYKNEKQLRQAVVYLYGVSSHFRRLIQYFVALSDLAYVVSPYRIDTSTAKPQTISRNFRRVLNLMSSMDVKNQFEKILTVCLREDVFYGTIREGSDSTIIQQLPSDYCSISVIEDNVANVSFDFSYFQMYPQYLELYPDEFKAKYNLYQKDSTNNKWQELDAPYSFAIKCNKDILSYAMPPFAGILREIYDLEDYRQLKLTKTELENYAMLVMNLPMNDEGEFGIDYNKAVDFYNNLDSVLPEEVGSVLSPMEIGKISFERNHAGEVNTIADAEDDLFTAAGVSSLLFNNPKASANALLLSIKADQALTFSIVKSIECMVNRFIHRHGYGKYFKVTFLDCSIFNRKEMADGYIKAASYGLPTLSMYAATQGLSQDEFDCMNFLEDSVLDFKSRLKPLMSSATMSSSDSNGEAGRNEKDIGELSDSGEVTRERGEE